ncbi:MAG: hypothetical protein KC736_02050 [Candidatus Moranbacteria bacterium]|nr:hypothetical protein [Candidatus Moranbacteria bacterium]
MQDLTRDLSDQERKAKKHRLLMDLQGKKSDLLRYKRHKDDRSVSIRSLERQMHTVQLRIEEEKEQQKKDDQTVFMLDQDVKRLQKQIGLL